MKKSMEERTVVESALAAANAHIDDLKDEVAATKKRLDDSYDKADALVATIKDKNALIDQRELEILNLHMHLDAVAQTWVRRPPYLETHLTMAQDVYKDRIIVCDKCDRGATQRVMACGHVFCSGGCCTRRCRNCDEDMTSPPCSSHLWDNVCPRHTCVVPATEVVPLTGSQPHIALSYMRPHLIRAAEHVEDISGLIDMINAKRELSDEEEF